MRLVETPAFYFMYEGKREIYKFVKKQITRKTVWLVTTDYAKYLKDLQQEFVTGNFPIDKLVDSVERKMRIEFQKRLNKFFKVLHQKNVQQKTESFFKLNIFPKLSDVFSGFNKFINNMIKDVLNDLDVQVVNDVDDTGTMTPKSTAKMLKDKKKLMINNIAGQVKTTKDNILQDIKRDLSSGMEAGQKTTEIQKSIEKKYNYKNGSGWKSKRVIRTELHNANTVMLLKKWDSMGFEEVEHIVREDEKLCKQCASMNKKVFKINDLLSNKKKHNPQHPNCRCSYEIYS